MAAEAPGVQVFAVIDGLGHGPDAAKSADAVAQVIRQFPQHTLQDLFASCDRALSGLRGVVMSAVRVEPTRVLFAGVGNVDIYGPRGVARPACMPGTLGSGLKRFREFELPAQAGQRWALVSDGLRARDMTKALEATAGMSPTRAAQELIALAARPDDDACALVVDFMGSP